MSEVIQRQVPGSGIPQLHDTGILEVVITGILP